jgi:hypothetical protein
VSQPSSTEAQIATEKFKICKSQGTDQIPPELINKIINSTCNEEENRPIGRSIRR